MRCSKIDVVYQEVPDEISLAFFVTGCPMRCKGCHSKEYQNPNVGNILTIEKFESTLTKYKGLISCVLFFGGEWYEEELEGMLRIAKEKYKLKTCLYTGRDKNHASLSTLKPQLDFLKYGEFKPEKGGIQNINTNQVFLDLNNNTNLTYLFQK